MDGRTSLGRPLSLRTAVDLNSRKPKNKKNNVRCLPKWQGPSEKKCVCALPTLLRMQPRPCIEKLDPSKEGLKTTHNDVTNSRGNSSK